ncbi:MAG: hypothetical protein AAB431_02710 [Patescibacteria group bacterium]
MASDTHRFFWPSFFLIAIIFFVGTLFLSLKSGGEIFVSPDETANAFFAEHFAHTGTLTVLEPLNDELENTLHPRSVLSQNAHLVPAGFLGLPVLYGLLVFFFGKWTLLVITPLIAILAALAFGQILSKIFSKSVSQVSTILFLSHPAVWYYSARGLMPNVLFTSLVIFSVFFFLSPLHTRFKRMPVYLDFILAGIFLGLALFVRASEVYWIVPVCFFLFLFFYKHLSWKIVSVFLLGLVVGLIPFFLFNLQTYGGLFLTGYTLHPASSTGVQGVALSHSSPLSYFPNLFSTLFPFGLSLRSAIKHILAYGFYLFSFLTLLSVFGLSLVIRTLSKKDYRPAYLFVLFVLSVWLGLWYGSWTIFDNPDPTQITMANSYVRYWLPIYVLCIPLIAELMIWMTARIPLARLRQNLLVIFCALIIGYNGWMVFFHGQDGLVRVTQTLTQNKQTRADIFERTPVNSIFIVDRADKLFFPYRHVLYPLRSEKTYELMPALSKSGPLYYYGITFPQSDIDYLNGIKLKQLGLQIEFLKTYDQESLYHIYSP